MANLIEPAVANANVPPPLPGHQAGDTASAIPRPEHPRPTMQRQPWLTLNGRWRFTFDPDNVGEQLRWHRLAHPALNEIGSTSGTTGTVLTEDPYGSEIVVPFPWECRLSEVNDPKYKGAAWYQRLIVVPAGWAAATPATRSEPGTRAPARDERDAGRDEHDAGGLPSVEDTTTSTTAIGAGVRWHCRPFLCFGAVDWQARVWINGRFVGEHEGGYTPFAFDLSRYVRPGQPATLTVRVWDASDAATPIGKQTARWYTPSSGIWQTVWLEGRPAAYLDRIHITPQLAQGQAVFDLTIANQPASAGRAYRVSVQSQDEAFPTVEVRVTLDGEATEARLEVPVPEPRPWSPEDPHLYDCTVSLSPDGVGTAAPDGAPEVAPDRVVTYFGLRSVSRGPWEGKPYEYVLLNGEPVYLRGALDQAFHPDGLHAYPTDDAIRADVQAAKDLGLNLLRCHIKINDPRYYYWCDRLGVLVMYDLPSAGVYTPTARANWERTFREAVARDYSHPCIFSWVLFNETWGLEEHETPESWYWVKAMFELAKTLDATRLVEDNSATLYDHVVTDLNTWHFYIADYDRARRHVERVVRQTYAGSGFNFVSNLYHYVAGAGEYKQGSQPLLNSEYAGLSARQGDRDISYSFKFLTAELRRHDKICGYVYTELTDVEWEHNGLLNYDRSAKEFGYDHFFPGMTVADLNGPDFVGLDCPPCQTLPPGATFRAPAFVSHWSPVALTGGRLKWRTRMIDRFGEAVAAGEGERPVAPRRYGVTDAGDLEIRLPDEPGLVTIALWLEDGDGRVRARNYVNVDVHDPAAALRATAVPVETERTAQGYALPFRPGDFADTSWVTPTIARGGGKFAASGAGWVEYALTLPEGLDPGRVRRLRLRFEAGARTARNRIGWKDPLHVLSTDFPQTEALKLPTDVQVSIGGVNLGQVTLPDDPADARGVLSIHLHEPFEFGSYGYLITLEAGEGVARRILEQALASRGQVTVHFEVPRRARRGGLSLYGSRMGAYPCDPTLFLDTVGEV